jgi:5-oxoprolinase (ATP-hydrolysing)
MEQTMEKKKKATPPKSCACSPAGAARGAALPARGTSGPGSSIDGPAIIAEANATTVVEPDWRASVTALDHLVLERFVPRKKATAIGTQVDPVMLEIFNNLYMSIAEQMACGCRIPPTP